MDTKYERILNKLFKINAFRNEKINLDNIISISKKLGLPSNSMQYIHVGGTNGKGSCSLKIAKVLSQSNYKVGLFTSPHLFQFQERIMINDKHIPKSYILEELLFLFNFAEKEKTVLTFFEYVTLLGLNFFKLNKVDLAVMEVGIGGRIDSTNIITPIQSIIASIGFDHQDLLGYSLEKIAEEKAGIIKPGVPCIIGPHAKPYSVFERHAKEKQCKLEIVQGNFPNFQTENSKIAEVALENLKQQGLRVIDNYKQICEQNNPNCRMEIFDLQKLTSKKAAGKKLLVLDVGHNQPAINILFKSLNQKYPNYKWRILYGTSFLKDGVNCIQEISQQSSNIYLVQPHHFRAMKINNLVQLKDNLPIPQRNCFNKLIADGNIAETLKHNIDCLFQDENKNEGIVCIGSFLIMSEINDFLKLKINQISEL